MSARLAPESSPIEARIRTPLARVRGLGSAREGTAHFWQIRATAVAALLLTPLVLVLIFSLVGADGETVRRALGNPVVALLILLLVLPSLHHMKLGMQVIIEDYVHSEGRKLILLLLNTYFTIVVGAACVFAVLKLSFGA
jgi:succinate dehydrogenase / fumarate reductase, membrane anchor subunit